ncbi:DUF4328 domain-containing protein [Streptomyces sp. NPDC059175]|uniref:DUF4328 domain-containing protein n=1 Tax=unclassified Streptomyces TaxID=2593676 RepID=UPI00367B753E
MNHAPAPFPAPAPHPVPTARQVLHSPVGLSHALTALLGCVALANVLEIAAALRLRSVMDGIIADGTALGDEALELVDYGLRGSSQVYVVCFLATAVVFIVWFHRVRRNAGVFAPDLQRRGAGWAIGGWFVPFGNFWIPFGIAVDVLRASHPDPYGRQPSRQGILRAWWGAWVLSWFVHRFALLAYDKAQTAQQLRDAAGPLVVSASLDLVAALLAILFVRQVTRMQHAKVLGGGTVAAA